MPKQGKKDTQKKISRRGCMYWLTPSTSISIFGEHQKTGQFFTIVHALPHFSKLPGRCVTSLWGCVKKNLGWLYFLFWFWYFWIRYWTFSHLFSHTFGIFLTCLPQISPHKKDTFHHVFMHFFWKMVQSIWPTRYHWKKKKKNIRERYATRNLFLWTSPHSVDKSDL